MNVAGDTTEGKVSWNSMEALGMMTHDGTSLGGKETGTVDVFATISIDIAGR